MKLSSMILVLGTLPFLASCASWHTAGISLGLDHGDLTYQDAKKAIADGADVKSGWAGDKPFIQRAAELGRKDLVVLFLENGASPFEAPGGYKVKPFSLFEYVIENKQSENNRYSSREETDSINRDRELLKLCLKYRDASPEPMKTQLRAGLKKLKEEFLSPNSEGDFAGFAIKGICSSGILSAQSIADFNVDKLVQEKFLRALKARGRPDVAKLIAMGADVNAKDENGHSVLYIALSHRAEASTVNALKAAGAKLTPQEAGNVLSVAVRKGWSLEDIEIFKRHGAKLPDKAQMTEDLWHAVKNFLGSEEELDRAIALGADVNAKDKDGHSVLYVAIHAGIPGHPGVHFPELTGKLARAGAKFTPQEAGEALLATVSRGANGFVGFSINDLIEMGADLTIKDEKGRGLVAIAASNGGKKTVEILMQAGAPTDPGYEAEIRTNTYLKYLEQGKWNKVSELIQQGFDLTRTNKEGKNAFHALAACLDAPIDESFIIKLKDADSSGINRKTTDGWTPLAIAINGMNKNAVRLFLKHGANPNATCTVKGKFGSVEKSLMTLAIEKYNEVVEVQRNVHVTSGGRYMLGNMNLSQGEVDVMRIAAKEYKEIVSLMSQATGTEVVDL